MKTTSDDNTEWTIEFSIDQVSQPVRLNIEDEAQIGRLAPGQTVFFGLDLTPYRGDELGVSRQHAVIRLRGDDLMISDLRSSNGTALNGQRLQPELEYKLNDGDQLVLGHLEMKVRLHNDLGWSTIQGRRTEFSLHRQSIKGRGQRILVVEDDSSFADLYRTTFEREGYTTQCCREVVSAMRILSGSAPALILLDLMLPNIHGLELCRYVRRDTGTPALPIVVVSAASDDAVEQALEAGADVYLAKPINIKELSRVVSVLIHKNEMEHPSMGTKQLSRTAALHEFPPLSGKDALVIFVEGRREPIGLTVDSQIILGRHIMSPSNHSFPPIDLDVYGAFDKGVSRTHARVIHQSDSFLLEDMGSTNGTLLNGKPLQPHRPTRLNNSDEIRLGELRMSIYLPAMNTTEANASASK